MSITVVLLPVEGACFVMQMHAQCWLQAESDDGKWLQCYVGASLRCDTQLVIFTLN